jgi:alkylation response protein AidB-like acyl-CoA dehydrogenase
LEIKEMLDMDFALTNEQKELQAEIITFSNDYLNDEKDRDSFSYEMWNRLCQFGLFGINVSEEYGGMGESYLTSAIAIEALGYGCKNNGFVFVVNNHIWVGLNIIYLYGSDLLKKKYLREMVEGKLIASIAITEADSGSDAFSMKTTATEDDDVYILNGSKMFISNGNIADVFLVFAQTNVYGQEAITGFVVEKNFEGVTCGPEIEKMGLDSCPMCEVTFKNVRLPKENILGGVGNGKKILTAALEWERCYEFASHVGAMQRVMEKSIKYANEREQFGKPISSYQSITHKIADMRTRVELSRLLLYKIAWLKDQKKSAYIETSIFKVYVSESYIATCKDAMQIMGAYGYTKEYGIECEMRDALACSIYSGTNEIQRNTIYGMSSILA